MFNLYGNPALTTHPDIAALTEIQEPTGVKEVAIPFRKMKKEIVMQKSTPSASKSIYNEISNAVDCNLSLIHRQIAESLYRQLGVEPRELSMIEQFEYPDAGFGNRGYIYSYDCSNGPVNSRIIAKIDETGKLIS